MWLPSEELGKHNMVADYCHYQDIPALAERAKRRGLPGPGAYDLYVLPRGGIRVSEGIALLKNAGKKLVFEVDDDFTNEHRQVIGNSDEYATIWGFARDLADAITVSTPYLADLMRQRVGKHKPIYVLPNSVRWEMWQNQPKVARLTIGLTGSLTHGADWAVLEPVLPRLLGEFPEVDLQIAGFVPEYLQGLAEQYPERVSLDTKWRDYRDYPALVARSHIVLCPVEPTDPFNFAKSGIKAIEGLAAGAAVVASDINIYRPVIGANKRGLLADFRPESWYEAIKALIIDPSLRQRLTTRGQRWVREHHSMDLNWHLWQKAYQEIAGR
jgi:glycosyltransferase involved in cell wall biosynthesis